MIQDNQMFSVRVPSNIALVKYWGKSDSAQQWPANDSISMTLANALTETAACVIDGSEHLVTLNGKKVGRSDHPKIFSHLDWLLAEHGDGFPGQALEVVSSNSFPTGCGIASSASGFGALTLAAFGALVGEDLVMDMMHGDAGREQIAHWARQGSGSGGRSLFGGYVKWERGADPATQRIKQLHKQDHWDLVDLITVFSDQPKSIGSTLGHKSAWTSPLFEARLRGLPERIKAAEAAIAAKDLDTLGPIIEADALEMHSVMMSSEPALRYFGCEVGQFLALIRDIRQDRGLGCYFTIDAGPNVHVITTPSDAQQVSDIIKENYPGVVVLEDKTGGEPSFSVKPRGDIDG